MRKSSPPPHHCCLTRANRATWFLSPSQSSSLPLSHQPQHHFHHHLHRLLFGITFIHMKAFLEIILITLTINVPTSPPPGLVPKPSRQVAKTGEDGSGKTWSPRLSAGRTQVSNSSKTTLKIQIIPDLALV